MYDDPGCSNLAQAVLRLTVSDFQEEELVVDAIAFAYGDTLEFWTAVVGIEPEAVRNRFVDLSVCSETRQVQQENIMRKVAFISEKGGVGKSTLCINIAAVLADAGQRVLIVDLDGVACISRTLTPDITDFQDSIGAALIGARMIADVIHPTPYKNLWVAPGTIELKDVEQWELEPDATSRRMDAEGRLLESALALELDQLAPDAFDFVMVDCPGGQPFMGRAALLTCDEVVIPTGISTFDFFALTPTIEMIVAAREMRGNGVPAFLGFIPNGATARGIPQNIQEQLGKYDAPIFPPVRESRLLRSAPGWSKLDKRVLVLSRPKTAVAESIRQVAREIDPLSEIALREPNEIQMQEAENE